MLRAVPGSRLASTVYALITPFLQLCLLNRGPQDLPASRLLLGLALTGYLLVGVAMGWPYYGLVVSVAQSLVEIGILVGFTYLVLRWRRHPGRFVQTLTALAGVGVVLGALLLPLVYSMYRAELLGESPELPALAYIAVFGWLVVAYGQIFRHALALKHLGLGILVAVAFVVLASGSIELLFSGITP